MSAPIILASGSEIRQLLLRNAGVSFDVQVARVDEEAIKAAMIAEKAPANDIADALAEAKARKVSQKMPGALVIGCDQVLECGGAILSKPENRDMARAQLDQLNDSSHKLLSAAVIYMDGQPQWRHVGTARLTMRNASDGYLDDYLARNWDSIQTSVGCYKLEEEGVRLFSRIEGDYFTVLGLPLTELLGYLTVRGDLAG
ncbi:MAG: Maf family nucleotide pyrophosphatase [Marinosulfonomonas sp.]|nr:Maf family nucleotide pyrophosphatase [Marinosulfonomonas sp.]